MSLKKINDLLKDYIFRIATGAAQPPDGFTTEWFQDACGKTKDHKRFVRDFPEALKKRGSVQYQNELLRSAPSEDPIIPPVPLLDAEN